MRTVWGKEWVRSQVFHEAGRKAWYTETRTNAGRALPGTLGGNIVNLLFFLTPKQDVAFIYNDFTLRQTLEKMEYHRYSSVPVLARDGTYVGTITEGDLLWTIKRLCVMDLRQTEEHSISEIEHRRTVQPVRVDTRVEDLISVAAEQNFVPVIDDKGDFIGIVTRSRILRYYLQTNFPHE